MAGAAVVEIQTTRPPTNPKPYLYGVQGLRTVAALMVAVYHIWFHRVSGGVDVFFVVAGYFATASMAKIVTQPESRQRLAGVGAYLLRTARRVVPSATVVIVATVGASILLMSPSLWEANTAHGFASMFFFENWHLISEGNDYLANDLSASPFQQFWALAIQVQSYVIFPLLALIAAAIARLLRTTYRRALLVVAGVVFAASLTFSAYFTSVNQAAAYFHLGSRFWEFLAGALLAVALGRLATRPVSLQAQRLLSILGWAGLAVIVSFAAVVDASQLLPGFVALVPVGAAAAIIVSARFGAEPGVLKARPLLWFADSSFAFYLWHWPILVTYQQQFGRDVSLPAGMAILFVSAVLAVVTTKFVEQPIRSAALLKRSAVASILAILLLLAPSFASLIAWGWMAETRESQDWAAVEAVLVGNDPEPGSYVPSTLIARQDLVAAYAMECQQGTRPAEVIECEWGATDSSRTVALVGGSHDTQWIDAIAAIAEERDLRLISITKGACPFGDVLNSGMELHPSCPQWIEQVTERLIDDPPELVITTATRTTDKVEEVPEWKMTQVGQLLDAGIPVLGVRDNPSFGFQPLSCLENMGADACYVPRADGLSADLLVPDLPGFTFLDMADEYCDEEVCPVVDEGITTSWDGNHLTRTWTMLNSEKFAQAIDDLLPQ